MNHDETSEMFRQMRINLIDKQQGRLTEATGLPDDDMQVRRAMREVVSECGPDTINALVAILTRVRSNTAPALPQVLLQATDDPAPLQAFLTSLDEEARTILRKELRNVDDAETDAKLLELIRARVASEYPGETVTHLVFHTAEWDNGFFLSSDAVVYLADPTAEGHRAMIDFGSEVEHLLSESYGVRGASFKMGVDLRTGQFDSDDYDVYSLLGIEQ